MGALLAQWRLDYLPWEKGMCTTLFIPSVYLFLLLFSFLQIADQKIKILAAMWVVIERLQENTLREYPLTLDSHGEPYRHFSAIIGWKALSDSVGHFGHDHGFTKLVTDLKGKDPDDAFSSVPYEKGFNFLFHLETILGKAKFDRFIPHVCLGYALDFGTLYSFAL